MHPFLCFNCSLLYKGSLSVSDSDNSLEDYQVPGEDQEDDIDKDEMEDTDVGTEEDEDEVENGDEDEKEDFDGILPKIDAKDDKVNNATVVGSDTGCMVIRARFCVSLLLEISIFEYMGCLCYVLDVVYRLHSFHIVAF